MLHGLIIPKCSPTSANFMASYSTQVDSLPVLSSRVHLSASVIGHESLYPCSLYSTGYPMFCGASPLHEKEDSTTLQSSTIISGRLALVEMIERIFIIIVSIILFRIIFKRWRNKVSNWPYLEKYNGQKGTKDSIRQSAVTTLALGVASSVCVRQAQPTFATVNCVT